MTLLLNKEDVGKSLLKQIKGLLARWHAFPQWNVCPPMIPVIPDALDSAAEALSGPY